MKDENKKEKLKKGRPSKYDPEYHDGKAFKYFSCGYTNSEVAKKFGISPRTLDYWIENQDSFKEMVQDGRERMVGTLETNLFQMAFGYTKRVQEPRTSNGKTEILEYDKYFPKSFSATRFLVTNLLPHKYRDRPEEPKQEQDNQIEIIVKKSNG